MGQVRGKLTRVEGLPPEIRAEVNRMLRDGLTQQEIIKRMRQPLADIGEADLSKSGLSRYAIKMFRDMQQLRQYRTFADQWAQKMGDAPQSEIMPLLREVVGTLAFDYAMRHRSDATEDADGDIDVKGLSQLALLMQRLEKSAELGLEREAKLRAAHAKEIADKLAAAEGETDPMEAFRKVARDLYGLSEEVTG